MPAGVVESDAGVDVDEEGGAVGGADGRRRRLPPKDAVPLVGQHGPIAEQLHQLLRRVERVQLGLACAAPQFLIIYLFFLHRTTFFFADGSVE